MEDIRQAVKVGKLHLSREQTIGVECYDDINEDMERSEVEAIGQLVIDAFHMISDTKAEATIMGSFRRGKASSGDVDILITMKKHLETIPRDALPKLVGFLSQQGHIAHHISRVRDLQYFEEDGGSSPANSVGNGPLVPPEAAHITAQVKGGTSSKSYMGVFYSPRFPKKRRRVDIKIYPYNQKAFASLCMFFVVVDGCAGVWAHSFLTCSVRLQRLYRWKVVQSFYEALGYPEIQLEVERQGIV